MMLDVTCKFRGLCLITKKVITKQARTGFMEPKNTKEGSLDETIEQRYRRVTKSYRRKEKEGKSYERFGDKCETTSCLQKIVARPRPEFSFLAHNMEINLDYGQLQSIRRQWNRKIYGILKPG